MFSTSGSTIFDENGFKDTPHVVVRYEEAPVYFRLSRRGQGMEIHIACEGREGKLAIRAASREVIRFVKSAYPWCDMLMAPVKAKSVYNLCKNIGFEDLGLYNYGKEKANLMVVEYGRNN